MMDSYYCCLQLEVLTNLANETNISTILREFQVKLKNISHVLGRAVSQQPTLSSCMN